MAVCGYKMHKMETQINGCIKSEDLGKIIIKIEFEKKVRPDLFLA